MSSFSVCHDEPASWRMWRPPHGSYPAIPSSLRIMPIDYDCCLRDLHDARIDHVLTTCVVRTVTIGKDQHIYVWCQQQQQPPSQQSQPQQPQPQPSQRPQQSQQQPQTPQDPFAPKHLIPGIYYCIILAYDWDAHVIQHRRVLHFGTIPFSIQCIEPIDSEAATDGDNKENDTQQQQKQTQTQQQQQQQQQQQLQQQAQPQQPAHPSDTFLLVGTRCIRYDDGTTDENAFIYRITPNQPPPPPPPQQQQQQDFSLPFEHCSLVRRFCLGDGIQQVMVDDSNHILVGYYDEGVIGNKGWRCTTSSRDPAYIRTSDPNQPISLQQHYDKRPLGVDGVCYYDIYGHRLWGATTALQLRRCIEWCRAVNVDAQQHMWIHGFTGESGTIIATDAHRNNTNNTNSSNPNTPNPTPHLRPSFRLYNSTEQGWGWNDNGDETHVRAVAIVHGTTTAVEAKDKEGTNTTTDTTTTAAHPTAEAAQPRSNTDTDTNTSTHGSQGHARGRGGGRGGRGASWERGGFRGRGRGIGRPHGRPAISSPALHVELSNTALVLLVDEHRWVVYGIPRDSDNLERSRSPSPGPHDEPFRGARSPTPSSTPSPVFLREFALSHPIFLPNIRGNRCVAYTRSGPLTLAMHQF